MNLKHKVRLGWIVVIVLTLHTTYAENIDPQDNESQYTWGENVGWLNFDPCQGPGATVSDDKLTGYVWAENIGWINLDPCDSDPCTGISNDGTGILSGYAWGENIGWINFNPQVLGDSTHYGVYIDEGGDFHGWGWGENIGWVRFDNGDPILDIYGVRTTWLTSCIIDMEDLENYVAWWLEIGADIQADLSPNGQVDLDDFSTISALWLKRCPPGWPL